MHIRRVAWGVVAASVAFSATTVALVATGSPAVAAATTNRVSLTASDGQSKGGASDSPSLSADGRYVAFSSTATNLVPGDTNALSDVFVRDTVAGTTTRVSVTSGGAQANGASDNPAISNDGHYVAFHSVATNLVASDTNSTDDIFVRDLVGGSTSIVSVSSAEVLGNGAATDAAIDGDGRFVAFRSLADNLVSGDTLAKADIFVRDTIAGTTERVSVSTTGGSPNGNSAKPSISADGLKVAFQSNGANISNNAMTGKAQIYVRDRLAATNTAVSIGTDAKLGNGDSTRPRISGDGTTVVWTSAATNLVVNDTNGFTDVFSRSVSGGAITRVSVNPGGGQANGASQLPTISTDGGIVAFQSSATGLLGPGGDTNGVDDVFVAGQSPSIVRASVSTAGTQGTAASTKPAVSPDGQQVGFRTVSALASNDTNNAADIYVRDVTTLPDLAVTLTDSDDPVAFNDQVTYIAAVTNHGSADATNVTVTLPAIPGTASVDATAPFGCDIDAAGATCTVGPLAVGGSANVTYTVQNNVPSQTTLTETATATPDGQTDRNNADNTGTQDTTFLAAGGATGFVNWDSYLKNGNHTSYSPDATAITPANAPTITKRWTWRPDRSPDLPGPINYSSPTVVNGTIYLGNNNGYEYAIDAATGTTKWKRFLGYTPKFDCAQVGIVASATVQKDPQTGVLTVYTAAGDNAVYALNAATGAIIWRTQVVPQQTTKNDYYLWASPTIRGDSLYQGISSQCDRPLIRGGVDRLDRATGQVLASFWNVPSGKVGASVLSSIAAPIDGTNAVYETTGNTYDGQQSQPWHQVSIVRLDGSDLSLVDSWKVPLAEQTDDPDFVASPTLWSGTDSQGTFRNMIGACDKNGVFYALDRDHLSAGPVWQRRIGPAFPDPRACIGTASYDGNVLYVPGNQTTIGGVNYLGSVRALNPMTGALIWEQGFNGNILAAPTINGSGVLGVEEFSLSEPPLVSMYLVNAATGAKLTEKNGGFAFGGAVFADDYVLYPSVAKGLTLWAAP